MNAEVPAPIPMRIHCPGCGELHIDEGEFATRAHHTHACQICGLTWRPAVVPTVGVRFLPGFRNDARHDSKSPLGGSDTLPPGNDRVDPPGEKSGTELPPPDRGEKPARVPGGGAGGEEPSIDWSRFVPAEIIPYDDALFYSEAIPDGTVFATWARYGAAVWRRQPYSRPHGHNVHLAGPGNSWMSGHVRIVRHADGRWADGYGPDGPIEPPAPAQGGPAEPLSARIFHAVKELKTALIVRGDDGRLHSPRPDVLERLSAFRALAEEADALATQLGAAEAKLAETKADAVRLAQVVTESLTADCRELRTRLATAERERDEATAKERARVLTHGRMAEDWKHWRDLIESGEPVPDDDEHP